MGQFSWCFCDKNNKDNLLECESAYLLIPSSNKPCDYIYEGYYDGYGHFDGHDVYDLVVDWNKSFLSEENLIKPERKHFGNPKAYDFAMKSFKELVNQINDLNSGLSDPDMQQKYGLEWKRKLGIEVSCYDTQNAILKYPIKICKNEPTKDFDAYCPSLGDPNQGWYSLKKEQVDNKYIKKMNNLYLSSHTKEKASKSIER